MKQSHDNTQTEPQQGDATIRCKRCHFPLTMKTSQEIGYGHRCIKRLMQLGYDVRKAGENVNSE